MAQLPLRYGVIGPTGLHVLGHATMEFKNAPDSVCCYDKEIVVQATLIEDSADYQLAQVYYFLIIPVM